MATTIRKLTYDDLASIPAERAGDRHELIDGELVVTPSPVPRHQIISINIEYALVHHVRQHNLGIVLDAPIDVLLAGDTLLVPDLVFIAHERRHIIGPAVIEGPPDLVVEILSPGTCRRDLETKRELYARFGVREYWIVDPRQRTVTTLELNDCRYEEIPATGEGGIVSRLLPGLPLSLHDVFTGTCT